MEDAGQRTAWLKNIMPKFYLATRKDRSAEAKGLLEELKTRGWERTFTWTGEDITSPQEYSELALAELKGVRDADLLIVLLPGGYGTHVEIGAALALEKAIILCAPDQKTLNTPYACVFHYHPAIKLVISEVLDIDAILASLPA